MPESVPPSPPQRRSRSEIQRALSMPALAIATGTRPCAATAMESRANKAKNQTRKPTWSRHKKRLWLNSRSSKRSIKLWWVHHLSSIAMASPSINSMSQASKTNAPSPSGFPTWCAAAANPVLSNPTTVFVNSSSTACNERVRINWERLPMISGCSSYECARWYLASLYTNHLICKWYQCCFSIH